jgi:hypothetical protein
MTTSHSTEERISQWLEEAAVGQLPDRVLDATFETTRGLDQARASAWRPFPMSRPIPAMVAVGAAVIIVAAGVIYLRPGSGSNVGGAPSASAIPSLAGTITLTDTGCDWESNPGTLTDPEFVTLALRNQTDDYADFQLHWVRTGRTYEEGVALVAEIGRRLTTGEEWPPNDVSMVVHSQGVVARSETVASWPTAGTGEAPAPGLQHGPSWNLESGAYGVTCSANTSPTGDILTTFLVGPLHIGFPLATSVSTSFPPETIDTSGWQAFSSTRHGYAIRHPVDRRVQAANAPLTFEFLVGRDGEPFLGGDLRFVAVYDDMYDTFAAPDLYPVVGVTSTRIPDGMTEDEWLTTYGRATDHSCLPPRSQWDTLMIDGVPSGLYRGCSIIEALSFVSGRAYTFSVTRGMGGAPEVDSELLRAFLSTVTFHPETAVDSP